MERQELLRVLCSRVMIFMLLVAATGTYLDMKNEVKTKTNGHSSEKNYTYVRNVYVMHLFSMLKVECLYSVSNRACTIYYINKFTYIISVNCVNVS